MGLSFSFWDSYLFKRGVKVRDASSDKAT